MTKEEYESVVEQFPRLDLCGYVKEVCCGLSHVKHQATYDSFVGDFGDMFLREEGYSRDGKRMGDFLVGQREKMEGVETNAAYVPIDGEKGESTEHA